MSSYRNITTDQRRGRPSFRLLDLPIELQRLIFDHCFEPWNLQIIDNYWRTSKSKYFCLDQYCYNPNYRVSIIVGAPSILLALTCRYINREIQASMMKAYTGMLEISVRASHPTLPTLPSRLSRLYAMTTDLIVDERAFVDLYQPRHFPMLKELTISCFPIFCPDNFSGRVAPLSDESFQDWAKTQQITLERRSKKKLLCSEYLTVLDSQAEQWESDESVFCYLAERKDEIQVVRESLKLQRDTRGYGRDGDLVPLDEADHVCSRLHSNEQTPGIKTGTSQIAPEATQVP